MSILTDPVTETYVRFVRDHIHDLHKQTLGEVARALDDLRPRVIAPRDYTTESIEDVRAISERLFSMVEAICRRHDRARLLVLFRKTTPELAADLFRAMSSGRASRIDALNVFPEAMLFGTNCILTFSSERQPMARGGQYSFGPEPDEMADALRLAIVVFLHRHNVFLANSVARRMLTDPVVCDALLDSYNERQLQRMRDWRTTDDRQSIIVPASSMQFPREALDWRIPDGRGGEYTIWLRHFVPVPISLDTVREAYGYLAGKTGFAARLGCPFETWLKIWTALNSILSQSLGVIPALAATPETMYFTATRLDDYGESAMTSCPMESLLPVTHHAVGVLFPDEPPTLDQCAVALERLKYAGKIDNVPFPEQPFVFYEFAGGLTLWDGLRHHGLLRSVARSLSSETADAEHQGRALESQVAFSIRDRMKVRTASNLKLKERRNVVWQVDVTFAWRGVLFVVEAKNEFQNIPYFFEADEVRDRVNDYRGYLREQDRKLRMHATLLRAKVRDAEETEGAITVVCSREVEFIPTAAKEWWLTDTCPRVCRLPEFLAALPMLSADALRDHPAFVTWDQFDR